MRAALEVEHSLSDQGDMVWQAVTIPGSIEAKKTGCSVLSLVCASTNYMLTKTRKEDASEVVNESVVASHIIRS